MAIKVNGTTVIDDSRNLVNIVSGAGASTDLGAVGSYAVLGRYGGFNAGSLYSSGLTYSAWHVYNAAVYSQYPSGTPSGTWRAMGQEVRTDRQCLTVAVRVS